MWGKVSTSQPVLGPTATLQTAEDTEVKSLGRYKQGTHLIACYLTINGKERENSDDDEEGGHKLLLHIALLEVIAPLE